MGGRRWNLHNFTVGCENNHSYSTTDYLRVRLKPWDFDRMTHYALCVTLCHLLCGPIAPIQNSLLYPLLRLNSLVTRLVQWGIPRCEMGQTTMQRYPPLDSPRDGHRSTVWKRDVCLASRRITPYHDRIGITAVNMYSGLAHNAYGHSA